MASFSDVIWQVPFTNWIEMNTNGTSKSYPDLVTCVRIFKESHDEYTDNCLTFLGVQPFICAKFMGSFMHWSTL